MVVVGSMLQVRDSFLMRVLGAVTCDDRGVSLHQHGERGRFWLGSIEFRVCFLLLGFYLRDFAVHSDGASPVDVGVVFHTVILDCVVMYLYLLLFRLFSSCIRGGVVTLIRFIYFGVWQYRLSNVMSWEWETKSLARQIREQLLTVIIYFMFFRNSCSYSLNILDKDMKKYIIFYIKINI
jgi:hypothetical protein